MLNQKNKSLSGIIHFLKNFYLNRSSRISTSEVDLFDVSFYQNFYKHYPLFLSGNDVFYFKKSNCYGVFRYEVVKEVLQNKDVFLSSGVYPEDEKILLNADGEGHTNAKRATINHLEFIRQETIVSNHSLLGKLIEELMSSNTQNINIVDWVVNPFVLNVMMEKFGLLAHYPSLDILSPESTHESKLMIIKDIFLNGGMLNTALHDLNQTKSLSPNFQELLFDFRETMFFEEKDLSKFLNVFARASMFTTASLLASCLFYLAHFDNNKLDDDNYLEAFINEVLRINSPSQFTFRRTAKNTIIDNVTIPQNALVAVCIGAANRDESRFANSQEFLIDRTEKHLAFGIGKHKCIGDKVTMALTKYFLKTIYPYCQALGFEKDNILHENSPHIYKISQLNVKKRAITQNELTNSLIKIYNNAWRYYEGNDLVFFPSVNVYGAFKYNIVKDILNSSNGIGVSTVHLALNNIYFSSNEQNHRHNKKAAIHHLTFLSSKLQYADNEYTRLLFNELTSNFPKNQVFDLVDYLVNPIILLNIFKEYGFLETFPEFDIETEVFSFENAIHIINEFFSDTDKLELMLKTHLDNGGTLPAKMQAMLDDMHTNDSIDKNDLPRFFRSMIFSAVESTTSFLSTMIYLVFTQYPHLLTKGDHQKELYALANEALRIFTPVPFIYRTVWQDMTYDNVNLKKGDMVILFLGAANMDPSAFEKPQQINVERAAKHLSFGSGEYACIGRFASFRITMNVLAYLAEHANRFEFTEKQAKHYIHNSMLKLSLKVVYHD
jgi:cytochrome P450